MINLISFSDTSVFAKNLPYFFYQALLKLMKTMKSGDLYSIDCSTIIRSVLIWSVHDLVGLKSCQLLRDVTERTFSGFQLLLPILRVVLKILLFFVYPSSQLSLFGFRVIPLVASFCP